MKNNYEMYLTIGTALISLIIIVLLLKRDKRIRIKATKKSYLTNVEKFYFNILNKQYSKKYYIFPQINLASVVNNNVRNKYLDDLLRNIDLGIFSKDFKPLVLIQVIEKSKKRKNKNVPNKKVSEICKKSGINFVAFWADKDKNEKAIIKQVNSLL